MSEEQVSLVDSTPELVRLRSLETWTETGGARQISREVATRAGRVYPFFSLDLRDKLCASAMEDNPVSAGELLASYLSQRVNPNGWSDCLEYPIGCLQTADLKPEFFNHLGVTAQHLVSEVNTYLDTPSVETLWVVTELIMTAGYVTGHSQTDMPLRIGKEWPYLPDIGYNARTGKIALRVGEDVFFGDDAKQALARFYLALAEYAVTKQGSVLHYPRYTASRLKFWREDYGPWEAAIGDLGEMVWSHHVDEEVHIRTSEVLKLIIGEDNFAQLTTREAQLLGHAVVNGLIDGSSIFATGSLTGNPYL